MKPGHSYAINPPRRTPRRAKRAKKNPIPFAMAVANSAGSKRRRRKRRNPRSSSAGVFVIRGPRKNSSPMKTKRRRNSRKKKFNLLRSLGLTGGETKKRRNPRRRRKCNAVGKISSRNPMSKSKRRGSRRRHRKNPAGGVMRRNSHRRRRRRNPSRRGMRRNPIPVIRELFTSDNLATVAGVLLGSAGAQTVINYAQGANAAGQRRFSLPGVNYTNAQNSAMFYSDNQWILALYKLAIAGAGGFLLKGQSPRLARGIMLGGLVGAASDILSGSGFLSGGAIQLSKLGMSRNFGNGMGYLPGTNTQFTNPAQRFLANGNVPRPGMAARVGPRMVTNTENQVEGAYRGAN